MAPARSLLVIDGADDVLSSVGTRLRARGWKVFYASSAEEGILVAARETLSVILLDVDLPGMNGMRALGEFRRLSAVPVVLMTAYEDAELETDAFALGARAVLLKPLDLGALEGRLASVLV